MPSFPSLGGRQSPVLPTSRPTSAMGSHLNAQSPLPSPAFVAAGHLHTMPGVSGATRTFGPIGGRSDGFKLPVFVKRQMDFEMAIWEMTCLLISPKKVFRSMYHNKQTKGHWGRDDPSFVALLSFFLVLTSIAWGLAYTPSFLSIARLALVLTFVHFLSGALFVATLGWYLAPRFLRKGRTGRFGTVPTAGEGELEWAYCFDVAVRAFFVAFFFLYIVQFFLMPLLSRNWWISLFIGNTLYLVAFSFYCVVTFLGYNALPFLSHTEVILSPIVGFVAIWVVSLFGINIARNIAPLLIKGA
ncbi:hypothetical protein H072_1387 [Dactylellina haptotyla CBS 200.50]|uniref:UNC-50 family protein n=1 Tax=Dactylellina haptotyla (strain CBS 200.50) TaxID=1284197 RepID=S8AUJ5_DACHA|nr:hypothetical protein H072_1387 [Dactylellina haptotyla CBS 200.50]